MSQEAAIQEMASKIAAQRASQPGSIANLAAAFVEAKKGIRNVVKNATNPHFNSNYADLSAVLDTFTEPFAEQGLALLQAPGEIVDGNVTLMGLLIHKSGESISFRTMLPIGPKVTAQAAGAVITYARRYQAAAVAGIAQVDDDANAASGEAPAPRASKKTQNPTYAQGVEALLETIANAETVEGLEGSKAAVTELGDRAVADAYVARRKELKAAKGKTTT